MFVPKHRQEDTATQKRTALGRLRRTPRGRPSHRSARARSLRIGLILAGVVAPLAPHVAAAAAGPSATVAAPPAVRAPLPSHLLADERNSIQVFRRASASVVFITGVDLRRDFFRRNVMEIPTGSGSGFVWDKRGHVVTNAHVLEGSDAITVALAGGGRHRGRLVGADRTKDLAVLRIDAPSAALVPIAPGDSEHLMVGQKVLAIGNPFGLDRTLTTGVISALGREIKSRAGTTIQDVIQTDASINPGNSGGPLLDSRGLLVGVSTAIYSPSGASAGIGFAVPVGTVKRVVPQLIRYGRVKRAGLGVAIVPDDLSRSWGVRGALIRQVFRGGAAHEAGLRPTQVSSWGEVKLGDIIVGIDEREVTDFDTLFTALDAYEPGQSVVVHYLRGNRKRSVKARLQEIP